MDIFTQRHSPIGVDVGRDSVKLIQFRNKGQSLELVATARFEEGFPNNGHTAAEQNAFARDLKKLLAARKFGVRRAVITLPSDEVDVRPLTLPVDDEDVERKVRWEADSYLGYAADAAIIDHVVLGEAKSAGERRLEVLAAAVERDKVIRSLDLLGQAGLLTEAIDIVPLALCRSLHGVEKDMDQAAAAVDIGAALTHTVIMNGHELRMSRTIDFGGDVLTAAICNALEVNPEEAEVLKQQHGTGIADEADAETAGDAGQSEESRKIAHIINDILRDKLEYLATELSRLFRYFSAQNQGQRVGRVLLFGGSGSLRHLDTLLASRLGTEVTVGAPISQITGRPVELKDGNEGSFAVAAGLALRGA